MMMIIITIISMIAAVTHNDMGDDAAVTDDFGQEC